MALRSYTRRRELKRAVAADLYPVGFMLPNTADDDQLAPGWILCDGSVVSSAAYPVLHALLIAAGSPFGVSGPDPLLPDFRGRPPIGRGNLAVGDNEGLAVASRQMAHTHQVAAHSHPIPSHNHPYASHQHTSPTHDHTAESHQHSLGTHGHGISGITGGAVDGFATVDFGTPGIDRISFDGHSHGAGTYGSSQTDPGNVTAGGSGATGNNTLNANGGLTGGSTATVTGSSSDSTDPNTVAASGSSPVPFATTTIIIKAE